MYRALFKSNSDVSQLSKAERFKSSLELGCRLALFTSVSIAAVFSLTSYAADVSLIGTVDATSTGRISSAKMLGQGALKSGLFIDSSAYAVPMQTLAPANTQIAGSKDKLLQNSNKTSLFFGYGLYDWVEFHVGVKSTTDEISSSNRKEFFQRFEDGTYFERDTSSAESGASYAGSIFTTKFLAYSAQNLRLGVAGFIEEGVGSEGDISASKSRDYKLGYMGLLTYGYKHYGQINFNLGYRSRKAEELGGVHIGNESFAKTSIMYHINKRWGAYATVETRSIKVAQSEKPDSSGYLSYDQKLETASQIGFTGYAYKNYKVDLYVGGGLSNQLEVGNSERYFGLGVAVPLMPKNSSKSLSSENRTNSDAKNQKNTSTVNDQNQNSKVDKDNTEKFIPYENQVEDGKYNDDAIYSIDPRDKINQPKNSMPEEKIVENPDQDPYAAYPEMNVKDPKYQFEDKDDDFKRAQRRQKLEDKRKTVDIDDEIKKLQEKEAVAEKKVERKISQQDRKAQYEAYKAARADAERKVKKKLKKELGPDYEVTEEDTNWTGLE